MTQKIELESPDWLETLDLGVLRLDMQGKVCSVNNQAANLLSPLGLELGGKEFSDLFPEGYRKSIEKSIRRVSNAEVVGMEAELNLSKRTDKATVLLRFTPHKSSEGATDAILVLILVAPELEQARREIKTLTDRTSELENLVVKCPVTGIYNRRFFDLRFKEEFIRAERYGHSLGIGILDLDGFKPINDRFGHPLGDVVLEQTAETLKKTIRGCDVVARWGGDEFALIIPEVTPKKLLPMAIRIRQRIQANRISSDQGEVGVTASIGLACYFPEEETSGPVDLMSRADEALLQAKQAGGNRIVLHGHDME